MHSPSKLIANVRSGSSGNGLPDGFVLIAGCPLPDLACQSLNGDDPPDEETRANRRAGGGDATP